MNVWDYWWVALGPPFLAGAIAYAFARSINGQASDLVTVDAVDPDAEQELLDKTAAQDQWAVAHGFERLGGWTIRIPENPAGVAFVWERPGEAVWFACYVVQATVATDLLTHYADRHDLTTGSSASTMMFPSRPGKVKQAFTGLSLDELLVRHTEADRFLREQFRWRPQGDSRPMDQILLESIRGQSRYVKSLPLWPLRGVWWFLTMGMRANKPVSERALDRAVLSAPGIE